MAASGSESCTSAKAAAWARWKITKRPILLVGKDPLLVGRPVGDEIHQGQGVIGVGHGLAELAQRQAANPPVIKLQKFAVDFHVVLSSVSCESVALVDGLGVEIIEICFRSAGTLAVGPAGEFHLQHAHLDSHLHYFAAVRGFDEPSADRARLKRPMCGE